MTGYGLVSGGTTRLRRQVAAFVVLALVAFLATAVMSVPARAASSPRIMIVGDSISQGSAGDYTWRYRLWKHLQPKVPGLDFVGVRNDLFDNVANVQGSQAYADANFDRDHNALWGNTLDASGDTIQTRTAATTPDIMLVLLGINDLTFLTSPAGTEASLRRFIANARAGKPDVKFVFGRVLPKRLPASDTTFSGLLADYNNRLVAVAAQLSTTTSPIVIATTDAGYDTTADSWDGTHPNASGEQKIAAAFADRLSSAYGIGAAYPRPLPSVPLGPRTAPVLSTTPGNGQVVLGWTASPGATGYYVWTRNVTAGETALHRLPYPVPASPWTASLLVNGATYEFQLQATKGDATGVYSNKVTVKPTVPAPAGPGDFGVTAGNGEATLHWTAPANASGAYVWTRNVTAGETLHKLPYPVTSPWTAAGLVNGAKYEFQVQSVSGLIDGGYSAKVTVQPNGPAPAAPTDLTLTSGNGQATLHWTAKPNATGAYVWMRNVTTGEALHKLPYAVTSPWTAAGLINGAQYEFRVQSVNGLVDGGVSATSAVTPLGPVPRPPTDLRAAQGQNGKVDLTWSASANATGYYIWVYEWPTGWWKRLPYAVPGTSFTYAPATNGHEFYFYLQPVSGLQEADCIPLSIGHSSGCSNQVSALPDAPWHVLSLGTTHKQETGTYCGPAAIQGTLSYFGVSKSQSDIAAKVVTGPTGTLPWIMPDALNLYGPKPYDDHGGTTNAQLFAAVMRAVDNHYGPLIILVHSQSIPWGGGPFLEAHYLVITGYKYDDYEGGGPMYDVWDPASDTYNELRADSWESMAYLESIQNFVVSPNAAAI